MKTGTDVVTSPAVTSNGTVPPTKSPTNLVPNSPAKSDPESHANPKPPPTSEGAIIAPQEGDQPDSLTFFPFAYALLDECVFDFCWYCLTAGSAGDDGTLKRCAGCKVALFCGKACQKLGWIDHKPECKGLTKIAPGIPDVEIRMLGRIVHRAKAIAKGHDKSPNFYFSRTSERSIMDIWTHTDKMRANHREWDKFCGILDMLRKFYPADALYDDDDAIFEVYCRNFINRHAISDQGYMREIGKGLYLDMCAYDHSCRPNSIFICDGFVATLKPLSSSVNITDKSSTFYTYIDLLATKAERRMMLQDSWYFDCQCDRCMDDSERVLTSAKCESCGRPVIIRDSYQGPLPQCSHSECKASLSVKRLKSTYTAINDIDKIVKNDEVRNGRSEKSALEVARAYLEKFDQILPRINISYVRILQQVIILADSVEPDNHAAMAEYHAQAVDCMKVCYPKNHPALAYHLMNTGMFYARDEKSESAKRYLEEAKEMMTFTLGADHSMTLQVQQFLDSLPPEKPGFELESDSEPEPEPEPKPA